MKLTVRILFNVVIVGVVALLIRDKVSLSALYSSITRIGNVSIMWLIVLSVVWFVTRICKWAMVLSLVSIQLPWHVQMFSYARGLSLGLVTPMQIGELARAMSVPTGQRITAALLVPFDKTIDLIALASLAAVGVGFSLDRLFWGVAVGCFIIAGTIVLRGYILSLVVYLLRQIGRRSSSAIFGGADMRILGKNARTVLSMLFLGLVTYSIIGLQYEIILRALSPDHDIGALIVCPLIILAHAVPFSFSGFGIREGIAVSLWPKFGVSPDSAVAASLIMFVANIWIPLITAFGSLFFTKRRFNT